MGYKACEKKQKLKKYTIQIMMTIEWQIADCNGC